jgi:hypothetical protein
MIRGGADSCTKLGKARVKVPFPFPPVIALEPALTLPRSAKEKWEALQPVSNRLGRTIKEQAIMSNKETYIKRKIPIYLPHQKQEEKK